jgi:hypothetical protein
MNLTTNQLNDLFGCRKPLIFRDNLDGTGLPERIMCEGVSHRFIRKFNDGFEVMEYFPHRFTYDTIFFSTEILDAVNRLVEGFDKLYYDPQKGACVLTRIGTMR